MAVSKRSKATNSNHPAFPWVPPTPTKRQARALASVARGVAAEDQQKLAMSFIVNAICQVDDMEFRPEEFGGRDASAFAAGKRFVGTQIRKWIFATGEMVEALPDPSIQRTDDNGG